jgi:ankyrin repeat protein
LQGRLKELQDLLGESKPSASLLSDALVAASRGGHLGIAKELLERRADVERSSAAYGMTPLAAACLSGHREVAEELLRRGATPRTAQQMAALGCDRELARELEANPGLLEDVRRDETHEPLLHTAAAHGRIATAELLLKRGVPVDLSASDGLTPLHVAALHGRKDLVAYLLANKADVQARTRPLFLAGLHAGGHTPLHLALARDHPEVFAQLCDAGASLDDRNFPFERMLGHALYRKQGRMVEVLVAKRGKDHWPALLQTALNGRETLHNPELILEALVRLGVDVPPALPEPPIHWAMANGYRRLALLFIDRGADVRVVHDFGTPLARAAERGYDEIVRRLLERKVEVDKGVTTGTTPLQLAVFYGQVKCVELLLEHGADSKRIDAAARAALEASADADRRAIAELLKRHEEGK